MKKLDLSDFGLGEQEIEKCSAWIDYGARWGFQFTRTNGEILEIEGHNPKVLDDLIERARQNGLWRKK